MNFINSLGLGSWIVLLSIPALIVLLYFLKLKRMPLEVPSTYLWRRTIEDLHVNSIWQRLRRSLLLFLQLLLLALLLLACLRPGWRGAKLTGDRFIFLIDTSASMSATDQGPTRLEIAKQRAAELIDQMQSGDVAMIISFSDRARIEQSFTDNRATLRRKLKQIGPTSRPTDLREALRAADGLANPGRASVRLEGADGSIDVELEAKAATLFIFSDGGFAPVTDFALGNLTAKYVPIGDPSPDNVAVVAFTAERNPDKPGQFQAFAELENFGDQDVTVDVALYLSGRLHDADRVRIAAKGRAGIQFDLLQDALGPLEAGALRLEISRPDDLALDNVAYAAVNSPRRARILLVTGQNDALLLALTTDAIAHIAQLTTMTPDALQTKQHLHAAASGFYDLIIYDRCAPVEMPQANTFFIASRPPMKGWRVGKPQDVPIIIDTDRAHPLMQLVELGNVYIAQAMPVSAPAGGTVLIDSSAGPLLALAPREGYEDAVLGAAIVEAKEQGELVPNTDWPRRLSFPLFIQNLVMYLGGARAAFAAPNVQPGRPVTLRSASPVDTIQVQSPGGAKTQVAREAQNTFVFSRTEKPGIYLVREGTAGELSRRFVVNLFDRGESSLQVQPALPIGHAQVQGQSAWEPARKELWKGLLLAALAVLVFEWYVYNRRVYL